MSAKAGIQRDAKYTVTGFGWIPDQAGMTKSWYFLGGQITINVSVLERMTLIYHIARSKSKCCIFLHKLA
jgi:hypothetical protein